MKYVGRINSAKRKNPTPGQFYLFFFPAWKETELMIAFKGTVTQIKKVLINDCLSVCKVP